MTVRALHHYEAAGLLRPARTAAGHRRYGAAEVERLQQIVSLRALGVPLAEIGRALDADPFDAAALVARQRAAVAAEAAARTALAHKLGGLERLLRLRVETGAAVSPDTFLTLLTTMSDIETHYTTGQLQALAARREALGDDAVRAVEAEWPRLFSALGAELNAGTDPADARVQALVARWDELVGMFTGDDAGIRQSLGEVWEHEGGQVSEAAGQDPGRMRALFAYAQRAREARP